MFSAREEVFIKSTKSALREGSYREIGRKRQPRASTANPQSSLQGTSSQLLKQKGPELLIWAPSEPVQTLSVFLSQNLKTPKWEGA